MDTTSSDSVNSPSVNNSLSTSSNDNKSLTSSNDNKSLNVSNSTINSSSAPTTPDVNNSRHSLPPPSPENKILTSIHERLVVKILSFLDYRDIFVAGMVCTRWKKITEHPDLYSSLSMQQFINFNRFLPIYVLNNFVDALGLSSDELAAIRDCCRNIPRDETLIPPSPSTRVAPSPKDGRLKAEEKERQRIEKLRKEKEKRYQEIKKVWQEELLPNWEKKKGSKKTKRSSLLWYSS
eukprot:TRINITY_DN14813_c0_g1_i1.p1 TRINITY_DN14813_c0_g1~~TRINITY_DN14813_c0_g1_i1.p1  ORF type:complete len:236 (+),score=72.12 TRINITY_DN14813_c0_g1_i1:165-872(+)